MGFKVGLLGSGCKKLKINLYVTFFSIIVKLVLKISLVLERPFCKKFPYFDFSWFYWLLKGLILNYTRREFIFEFFVLIHFRREFFPKLKWIKCCSLPYNLPSGPSDSLSKCAARRVFTDGWMGWMDGVSKVSFNFFHFNIY